MRFGPPPDQPELSPWRWQVEPRPIELAGVRVGAVVLALFAIAIHADAVSPSGGHSDAGQGDRWFAIIALGMIACVRGDAVITLIRDAVMLLLAAVPAVALVAHVQGVRAPPSCSLLAPFLLVSLGVFAHVAIDLAMLRPVFAAVRARRPRPLPPAKVRR